MEEIKKDVESKSKELKEVRNAITFQKEYWRMLSSDIVTKKISTRLPKKNPNRILIFGEGSSYFASKLLALSLLRGKVSSDVIACSSTNIGVEVFPQKGDWVFALSHRGRTASTLRSFEMCARAGAFPIWVTGKGGRESPDSKLVLTTSSQEKCEPHTIALTSAICAVSSLLMGQAAIQAWSKLSTIQDPDLNILREQVQNGPGVLLGEWEGEWIARETRLKLIEMAQVRVPVFGSEEYFHGPHLFATHFSSKKRRVEEQIWYVVSLEDRRAQEIKDAFISAYLVEVRRDDCLSWVSALVRLQWMSLAVALNVYRLREK